MDINNNRALVKPTDEMEKKHIQITINEKASQINGLKNRLSDLVNVEGKRIELQIEVLEKEIEFLENKLAIDVQINKGVK